ncbi:MAG: hypothetical protein B0W54_19910 [Cellvibrio sp. 79]|nr:MAG: hypothetical protein B0W54_19910 [Cellvibrio sp. 79]
MMSYETLDAIADSYIPGLLMLFMANVLAALYKSWPHYKSVVPCIRFFSGTLLFSYGLMFIDNAILLWPRFDLDYSTHTAVALSLVFTLCVSFPSGWKFFAISMLAYAALMLYQRYHSVSDIVSTSAIISVFSFALFKVLFKKRQRKVLIPNNIS